MAVTIWPAKVETPTHVYTKARAILEDDGSITVNSKSGELLIKATMNGEQPEHDGADVWTLGDGAFTVTRMHTCGCGGTTITEKAAT